MEPLGINFGYLLVQLINLALIGGWLVLAVLALFQLQRRDLPETARAVWAALILLIPIGGAVAFWLVRPGSRLSEPHEQS